MNGIQKILYKLSGAKALTNLPAIIPRNGFSPQLIGLNAGVTIYPIGNAQTQILQGFTRNPYIRTIFGKIKRKAAQVDMKHYRIKTSERKTYWDEYYPMTVKGMIQDDRARREMVKMLEKSLDEVKVDSPLSKLLDKPNRNQSGADFISELVGWWIITGEGNTLLSRIEPGDKPSEMFAIPKDNIALVKGVDPWDIQEYKFLVAGAQYTQPKDNIIMWIENGHDFDPLMLSHLRGVSRLDAAMLIIQASNEGAERIVAMNKNQGIAGLAFNKSAPGLPTAEQAHTMRKQFDSIVNDSDLAGSIGVMNGEWGYIQFGMDAKQLQLIDQADKQFQLLCNLYDVPWQLFGNSDSYENRRQYKRDFIYDCIAPMMYSLRDKYNAKLIREYGLDRERDVIDIDILQLPEMTQDQKELADFVVKMGGRISYNEGREYCGWDKVEGNPNMDKHYVDGSVQTIEQVNEPIGGDLTNEMDLLNQNTGA